jgi:hypothetical protein
MSGASKTAIFIGLCFLVAWPFVTRAQRGATTGEWRSYSGDAAGTKYSPLDQNQCGERQPIANRLTLEAIEILDCGVTLY